MQQVNKPKKPMMFYYMVVLVILFLFKFFAVPTAFETGCKRSGLWNILKYGG